MRIDRTQILHARVLGAALGGALPLAAWADEPVVGQTEQATTFDNGVIGEGDQARMRGIVAEFPLRMILSARKDGEFVAPEAGGHASGSDAAPPTQAKGVTSREIETRSLTPAQRIAIEARLARVDVAGQSAPKRFRDRVAAADLAVNDALSRLTRAENALPTDLAPGAGDRVGTAGGYSRLRVEYVDRQQQLEDAVQVAQAGVGEAFRLRRAIAP
ncbi:MAG: hypothetical protein M3Z29_11435 [Pseudomonadota bacterium]|nr:hypothetical protein [Pseudomonadota bacterium]